MAAPIDISQRLRRKAPRLLKYTRQWVRIASGATRPPGRVIFVVGSQRSGTRLPLQMFDLAPRAITYSEGSSPYFDGVLLRPLQTVDALLRRNPFPVVILKPICETHRVLELLDHFPGSRAVWIFRHYRDAVNSVSAKWKSGTEAVRRLAAGDLERAGWRAGGLTSAKLDLVRRLWREDLSLDAANAIMWYLRNDLFFDLRAADRADILLVRYEDLVTSPMEAAARMFSFCNIARPPTLAEAVYTSSISRRPVPALPEDIDALCRSVEQKLIEHYRSSVRTDATIVTPRAT